LYEKSVCIGEDMQFEGRLKEARINGVDVCGEERRMLALQIRWLETRNAVVASARWCGIMCRRTSLALCNIWTAAKQNRVKKKARIRSGN
jgi:hypothetical protein